jgi:hypothetical protein
MGLRVELYVQRSYQRMSCMILLRHTIMPTTSDETILAHCQAALFQDLQHLSPQYPASSCMQKQVVSDYRPKEVVSDSAPF